MWKSRKSEIKRSWSSQCIVHAGKHGIVSRQMHRNLPPVFPLSFFCRFETSFAAAAQHTPPDLAAKLFNLQHFVYRSLATFLRVQSSCRPISSDVRKREELAQETSNFSCRVVFSPLCRFADCSTDSAVHLFCEPAPPCDPAVDLSYESVPPSDRRDSVRPPVDGASPLSDYQSEENGFCAKKFTSTPFVERASSRVALPLREGRFEGHARHKNGTFIGKWECFQSPCGEIFIHFPGKSTTDCRHSSNVFVHHLQMCWKLLLCSGEWTLRLIGITHFEQWVVCILQGFNSLVKMLVFY